MYWCRWMRFFPAIMSKRHSGNKALRQRERTNYSELHELNGNEWF